MSLKRIQDKSGLKSEHALKSCVDVCLPGIYSMSSPSATIGGIFCATYDNNDKKKKNAKNNKKMNEEYENGLRY